MQDFPARAVFRNAFEKVPKIAWPFLLVCTLSGLAHAQTAGFTVLTNFGGANGGYMTASPIQIADGTFYGVTYIGGTSNFGTVYKFSTNGPVTTLVSFTGTNGLAPGAYPAAQLALGQDGYLYGVTLLGGSNNSGSIFKVTTNGVFTSLFSFDALSGTRTTQGILGNAAAANATGGEPNGALTLGPDGLFYGTTIYGGTNGVGTLFKVTTNGVLTSLFSFGPITSNTSTNSTGAKPICGLTLAPDGSFCGVAAVSGSNGVGAIFRITTNGGFGVLSSFSPYASNGSLNTNNDGAEPSGALTFGPDGLFYGTTAVGGFNGNGTVFKITTNGIFTVLAAFNPLVTNGVPNGGTYFTTNNNGAQPVGKLAVGKDGKLYGTGSNGGLGAVGTIFSITTNGILTPLFSFDQPIAAGGNFTNVTGSYPGGLILGMDGNFYGTALKGGYTNLGTLFKVTPGTFNIQLVSGKPVVTWSDPSFTLQSASAAGGVYSSLPGATSPYTNLVPGAKFFRLEKTNN